MQGDRKAQYQLGSIYHYGKGGIKIDTEKAIEWYRPAAENGYLAAQHYLKRPRISKKIHNLKRKIYQRLTT